MTWKVTLAGGKPLDSLRIETAEGAPIARVFGPAYSSVATADLIAAAPDMLEALRAALVDHPNEKWQSYKMIEAAIAKAEGKT